MINGKLVDGNYMFEADLCEIWLCEMTLKNRLKGQ